MDAWLGVNMKVEIKGWYELSEEEQQEDPYGEDGHYLIITDDDGNVIRKESDCMEPEDASLYRDLSWVKDAIEQAYQLGLEARNK